MKDKLKGYFLINYLGADDLLYARARLIVFFSWAGSLISLLYALVYSFVPTNMPLAVFYLLSAVLLLIGFLLRSRMSIDIVAHFLTFLFCAAIVAAIYFTGGTLSIVLPWLCIIPVLASLLLDYRRAAYWFFITIGIVAIFFIFQENIPPITLPPNPTRGIITSIGLMVTLFFLVSQFDKERYQILNFLKKNNQQLSESQKEIEAQNEEIAGQNEQISAQLEFINQKNKEIEKRNHDLERYWTVLMQRSKSKNINFGDLQSSLMEIAQAVAESLGASRVSIWDYQKEKQQIECAAAYDADQKKPFQESPISIMDNPLYFAAMLQEEVISVKNAREDMRTRDFTEFYLKPNNIYSMLDSPFFMDGQFAGILCCEHRDRPRDWSHEDIFFTTSMTEIISLAYRASARRQYEINIKKLNKEIAEQNELLIQKTAEVEVINQTLEERVRERTEELTRKNEQLTEYAFINAHLLRGPLSRIKGLVNLMELKKHGENTDELFSLLKKSTDDLDQVIHGITRLINEGNLDRDHLRSKNA
jgi:GAF domain-containing protein